jgi:hypothetical protein
MKDLSLHLLDIAQNSIKAAATLIQIELEYRSGTLVFRITDNGCGMEPEILEKVTDPFTTTRTTRKVGMGLPLLKLSAEMTGGSLSIASEKGKGTIVQAEFNAGSIDRIPLGDMDETIKVLVQANPELDYEIYFRNEIRNYEFKTSEVKQMLNGVPIHNMEIIQWIGENIREGLKEVFGGVLNEISG